DVRDACPARRGDPGQRVLRVAREVRQRLGGVVGGDEVPGLGGGERARGWRPGLGHADSLDQGPVFVGVGVSVSVGGPLPEIADADAYADGASAAGNRSAEGRGRTGKLCPPGAASRNFTKPQYPRNEGSLALCS